MVSVAELKMKSSKLPPPDPNVNIPAAIRAASAQSDALHKQYYQTEEAAPDPAAATAEPAPTTAPTTATATPAPAPTPAPAATEPANWEQKYNSMKGRHDKQIETMNGLNAEIERLRNENAQLRANPPAAPAPVRLTNENSFKKITDEERQTFGDDFIDVSARAAREVLDPEISELRAEVANLKGQLGHVGNITAKHEVQSMNERLDKEVPDWRKINKDAKFIAWLNLRDAFSGATRIDMMRSAHTAGDASRVAAFFKGFLSDEATTAPAPATTEVTSQGKVPLETFAAPGRAKTSASQVTTAPDDTETISTAQIVAFYKAVNSGEYRGREEEKNRLERMIFDAQRAGRITG